MRNHITPSVRIVSAIVVLSSVFLFGLDSHADSNSATKVSPGTFSGAKPTVYPSWFKESFLEFSDDIAEAAEQGKRVMLLMHQDGCPYCNLLVERNLSQKNIVDLMRSRFEVIELNIWGDREIITVDGETFTEKEFASALRVQFTPTLLFFNEQGKPILTLNGYLPPNEFLTALRFVAEHHESQMSYRDFVHSQPVTGEGADKLITQNFFQSPPYNLERSNDASDKPLAVFFEQKQCPNCETLHHKVLVDEDTRNLLDNFDVVQLDMWSNQPLITTTGMETTAREWASDLNVSYAPTILLFNHVGEEVIRSEAWFKIFHTQSLFDYVQSESYQNEPNFQRYISARADHFIEQGIDVDIWR
ncbi:MAG: thioredoxin fold domain-containing protein [Acidiferrobacterales bacterium]|nr:thioredoxin fold domain-containing protein [Acidiferrobacterales bacterium]